ncbi:MAG: ROK family protein, partial [Saprospiraceae bacterium]|nr:ROK family protein [Saprospiraceae bacterium]
IRLATPQPAKKAAVAKVIGEVVGTFDYQDRIGVSFPTVVIKNRAETRGNLHRSWINTQIDKLLEEQTGHKYIVHNDADLAGLAEMQLGTGKGEGGLVVMVTIGTGLGTGVFYNGQLVPNIELGRIFGKDGLPIEFFAGDKARKVHDLTWREWGDRFNFFLLHVKRVFSPDLFILGGGASKKFGKFRDRITVDIPIKIAKFKNNSGIIGAAMAAADQIQ